MFRIAIAVVSSFALLSCGGPGSDSGPVDGPETPYSHVVSGGVTYTEALETSNSNSGSPESTGYALDNSGLTITGTFEASSPSYDYFRFSSAANSKAIVRAFVNGSASASTIKLQCQGYSAMPLIGSASLETDVAVVSGLNCNVVVFPAPAEAGSTYTIELIATP
jgi:hypothetical protein